MNQDQVKGELLKIYSGGKPFSVIFSGKKSTRVDGLYHPDSAEIIIHNKNFEDDNALMYTALHELAHHIQFTTSAAPVTNRAHTSGFWNIFHRLLNDAEKMGVYSNMFEKDPRFVELTEKIRKNYIFANAKMMKEFGALLIEAHKLCVENHTSFDDYVARVLKLHMHTARSFMKISSMDINPEIGFENMKTVASIKDPEIAREAENAYLEGSSPDMVRAEFIRPAPEQNRLEFLFREKEKIENMLERLTVKLAKIEQQISGMEN